MDSRIGLDYIVENREYIFKLGSALDTNNVVVKKQVFELLSALCAYNADGYTRAIETLELYKNLKSERYRFKIVVNELEKTTSVEYQVALLAFINCVIISASNLQDRIRIRNEFIGLKLLPLLNQLRKVAQSVGDIIVQLDVFDEQRECDEAQSLQGPNGINLSSHLDVFYAILRQVADTPQEVPFLSILQHLLRIDPKDAFSDVIWDTTEKLVHRATLLENHDDSVRLLRTTSTQKFSTCSHCRSGDTTSPSRKSLGLPPGSPLTNSSSCHAITTQPTHSTSDALAITSTPPPPPPIPAAPSNRNRQAMNGSTPPPPPPPPSSTMLATTPPVPPPIPGAPPPPPQPQRMANNSLASNKNSDPIISITPDPGALHSNEQGVNVLLPQQDTPAPKAKMKTFNWGKIPPNKVIGKQNIWTIVANNHQQGPMTDIDWNEMEGLFCLQSTSTQGSPKLGRDASASPGYDTLDRAKSKRESTEITLLDGKRSLNVNIFLKQFRSSNADIIRLIREGDHDAIGAEKLRGLLKILPEVDELDMLKSFNGNRNRLGNAETFLLELMEVPNYKLRIESMLLKEELSANVAYLDPCINAMIYACDDLLNNRTLQEVLYMVVVAGNFLNSGGYAGNAAGVKLASLQKLTDIRANKPGMNLIHFVALQAEKKNPELLKLPTQLSALENASKTTPEQIKNEINALDARIRKIKRQIEQPNTNDDIKAQMFDFLQSAEEEVAVLQTGMKEVEAMRLKLADFFCEDPATFKLEECFKIFYTFCEKFKQAVKENERRQQLEEQAIARRKQREEQLARRARQINQCGTPVSDPENQFLLDPTFDPRASPALSRRRMGSFNSGGDVTNRFIRADSNDAISPDITPNGSLRRRRSRVLAEEDDLMQFLRNSSTGQEHISRDRKAYGSLDRSWARRARSGSSSRKRPELLNIDFGVDRERASSPAPILQQQESLDPNKAATVQSPTNGATTPTLETKPRISREWRKKIETWLQSNDNDDKQNEEYKRKIRLVNLNRRSLENETESERKLDTLPEEKTVSTALTTTSNLTTTAPTTPTTNTLYRQTFATNPTNSDAKAYKRVYPDWKPSNALEHKDFVGTIRAIAEVNETRDRKPHYNAATRQSRPHTVPMTNDIENGQTTLNNQNSNSHQTSAEELRQYRRQRSIENAVERQSSHQLHAIAEEERRRKSSKTNDESESEPISKSSSPYAQTDNSNHSKAQTDMMSQKETATPQSPSSLHKSPSSSSSSTNSHKNLKCDDPPQSQCDDVFANLLSHHRSHNESKYNRKEIDADNIETPPVTRRIINANPNGITTVTISNNNKINLKDATSTAKDNPGEVVEEETPNYFDRYSLTRRTRRYKRPTDYSSGSEELTKNEDHDQQSIRQLPNAHYQGKEQQQSNSPLPPVTAVPTQTPLPSERTITKLEKVGRHISSINQEDVREAIRNLKSPTGTPERIWSQPHDSVSQKPPEGTRDRDQLQIKNAASKRGTNVTTIKLSNHELNDEGFEETQSLVSDTQSQGKESASSSCNETSEVTAAKSAEAHQSSATKVHKINNSVATTSMTPSKAKTTKLADRLKITKLRSNLTQHKAPMSTTSSLLNPQSQSPKRGTTSTAIVTYQSSNVNQVNERARSLKIPNSQVTIQQSVVMNNSPKRVVNIKKSQPDHENVKQNSNSGTPRAATMRRDVERSSSRNSLRSSRSSINSGASTNTVRRMPFQKPTLQTASVDSSPSKRPLAMQQPTATAASTRGLYQRPNAPNHVSEGDLGSNGAHGVANNATANIVIIRRSLTGNDRAANASSSSTTNLGASTSFKENNHNNGRNQTNSSSQQQPPHTTSSSRMNIARSANFGKSPMTQQTSTNARSNSSTRVNNFMRPTASSVTKRNK